MPAHQRINAQKAIDEVSKNRIHVSVVKKEAKFLPTPNHFSQTIQSITGAVTPKITSVDPRRIKGDGSEGLSQLHKARYIKIREDLERSHQMFPAQKYRLTVTSNHEFGFDVNKRTKQQMRSARIHSKPRVSSSITKFADQYYKIQGTSPYAKDSSKRKKH